MKKIMIALMAVATAAAAFAGYNENKEEAFRLTLADYQAKFEAAMADGVSHRTNNLWLMSYRTDLETKRLEFDAALAGKGISLGSWMYERWPKTSYVGIEKWTTNAPVFFSVFKAEPVRTSQFNDLCRKADFASRIALLNEMLLKTSPIHNPDYLKVLRNYTIKDAQKIVKRLIRMHGGSFVTKDGVNPVSEHLDQLAKALDAPKFSGLNEWLAAHDRTERLELTNLPSDEVIEKMKDDILYGEIEFSNECKLYLEVALGVEKYNAFVKEFNGDK